VPDPKMRILSMKKVGIEKVGLNLNRHLNKLSNCLVTRYL